ncbi:MAG: hypothetical protein JWQ25_376 [Daejeonella sp.]|nr:hypothetical protein [Daejeonella sp.]
MLDTRTRREYDQLTGLPGLLSQEALDEQLPEHIAELNLPVVFVVSPVPALSTPVMEEFAQPLASMIQGGTDKEGVGGAPIGAVSGALKRDMEAWGFSEKHLERLLERLAKFKKVVILSGDIHFGFSSFADYWKERKAENHARIVQLVSSPFKNGWDLEFVLLKSGFAQRLLGNFDFKFEKHGWKDKTLKINDSELDLKPGARMAPRHRIRLRRNPIVLPRHGWNIETIIDPVEPDWAWVMEVCVDQTIFENFPELTDFHFEIDKDLPKEIIDEKSEEPPAGEVVNEPVNNDEVKKTLLQMAARHNAHFKLGRNRRLIWQPHIGHVFFTISDDGLKRTILNHEFHYTCRSDGLLNNDRAPDVVPKVALSGPFTLHTVDLDVTEDKKVPPVNLNTAPPPPKEEAEKV